MSVRISKLMFFVHVITICNKIIEAEFQETKIWLRHHEDQWEELKSKWKSTSFVRLHQLAQHTDRTISSILSEYPVLRNPQGYILVQIDFSCKYSGKEELLFKNWPDFRNKIHSAFEADVADIDGRVLMSYLAQDDITEGKNSVGIN